MQSKHVYNPLGVSRQLSWPQLEEAYNSETLNGYKWRGAILMSMPIWRRRLTLSSAMFVFLSSKDGGWSEGLLGAWLHCDWLDLRCIRLQVVTRIREYFFEFLLGKSSTQSSASDGKSKWPPTAWTLNNAACTVHTRVLALDRSTYSSAY